MTSRRCATCDPASQREDRTISHSRYRFTAQLKREKSRPGFIIPTIAGSAVQSTVLPLSLLFSCSPHSSSSSEAPFRLSHITASSFSTPTSLNTPVSRARKPYTSRCRLHLTPFFSHSLSFTSLFTTPRCFSIIPTNGRCTYNSGEAVP